MTALYPSQNVVHFGAKKTFYGSLLEDGPCQIGYIIGIFLGFPESCMAQNIVFKFSAFITCKLATRAAQQMYTGGPVVLKLDFFYSNISSTHSMGQKVQNFALFSASLDFDPPFENAVKTNLVNVGERPMSSATLVKFDPCTTENHPEKVSYRLKLRKCAKSSITQPRIIQILYRV